MPPNTPPSQNQQTGTYYKGRLGRVSVQGVESLWGDCKFIPADWGS